jgi:hypothetical protein
MEVTKMTLSGLNSHLAFVGDAWGIGCYSRKR